MNNKLPAIWFSICIVLKLDMSKIILGFADNKCVQLRFCHWKSNIYRTLFEFTCPIYKLPTICIMKNICLEETVHKSLQKKHVKCEDNSMELDQDTKSIKNSSKKRQTKTTWEAKHFKLSNKLLHCFLIKRVQGLEGKQFRRIWNKFSAPYTSLSLVPSQHANAQYHFLQVSISTIPNTNHIKL